MDYFNTAVNMYWLCDNYGFIALCCQVTFSYSFFWGVSLIYITCLTFSQRHHADKVTAYNYRESFQIDTAKTLAYVLWDASSYFSVKMTEILWNFKIYVSFDMFVTNVRIWKDSLQGRPWLNNKQGRIQKRGHTTRYHACNEIQYKSKWYMQTKLERQNVIYSCRSTEKINVKEKM